MKAILVLLLACVCLASACETTVSHKEPVTNFRMSAFMDEISWDAYGHNWRVFITLSDILKGNTEHFLGRLEGDASAIVSVSLMTNSNGSLDAHAMIVLSNETYWIATNTDADFSFYMYKQSDVKHTGEDCVAPLSAPLVSEEPSVSEGMEKRAINTYKVAVFMDQNFANPAVNPWSSSSSIGSIFNDVNAVYAAAGLGQFQVDLYGTINNGGRATTTDLLPFFRDHQVGFDSSYTNSIYLIGSNIGGLAYLGSTCQRQPIQQRTCVAGLTSWNRLWTVKTITHELGHNRGAPHDFTNQCSGNQAGCQCSVMSYCFPSAGTPGGATNYFSSTSINAMRSAGCM